MKRIHLQVAVQSPAGPELLARGHVVGDFIEIDDEQFEQACAPHIRFGLGDLVALLIHRLHLDALARRLGLKHCHCTARRAWLNKIQRNLFGRLLNSRVR